MGVYYCEKYKVLLPYDDSSDEWAIQRAIEDYENTIKQLAKDAVMEMRAEEAKRKENTAKQFDIWRKQLKDTDNK